MALHVPATLLLATLSLGQPPADTVPLYDNLGTHAHPISTRVPAAQRYFDQGLRLVFAFNHGEAIRAFAEAARLDPSCAMCHWGIALAYGPHVNAPMDSASGVAAYAALRRAQSLASKASAPERAYIRALAARYAPVPPANRAGLDSAYAKAMASLVARYPGDHDAATLYAESLMDLSPWTYWTASGTPRPDTPVILAQLERVLAANPNHPGACHYFIHAVEAVSPERAVPCAERLASLMPGAGHMVHMPAHIYIRVGRWADAIDANVHALHADETYIAEQRPEGIYPAAYYPHNYHFLAFASTMAGRREPAVDAARKAAQQTPVEIARMAPELEIVIAHPHLTLLTFGRWEELLAEPMPPAYLRTATALAQYARGVAFAAEGRIDEARMALDTVKAIHAALPAHNNKTVVEIAAHALPAEIAARTGKAQDAIAHFRIAQRLEDSLMYIEPPLWAQPIRHSLAALLLRTGQAAEAEALYREDLKRFPENGWSLYGLADALRARGMYAEAEAVTERFRKAWWGSDAALMATRF